MLILSRKIGEEILIGDQITVTVQRVMGNRVSLGVEAPRDVRIIRGELRLVADSFSDPAEEQKPLVGAVVRIVRDDEETHDTSYARAPLPR